jgi:hypothetical protein
MIGTENKKKNVSRLIFFVGMFNTFLIGRRLLLRRLLLQWTPVTA